MSITTEKPVQIVLLSGPLAVGKTSVRQMLIDNFGFETISSSNYLKSELTKENKETSRLELQNLGDKLDNLTDYRWLIDSVVKPTIEASPSQRLWLIDAVRKERQVSHFKSEFPNAVFHVHLFSSETVLRLRYENRKQHFKDKLAPSYDEAINHPNESAARSLLSIADLAIDTERRQPYEIADLINKNLGGGSASTCAPGDKHL